MFANSDFYVSMRTAWAEQVFAPQIVVDADDDSAMPPELRNWLVNLRLLHGVPFANLIADTELLPAEIRGERGGSIRWFYMDRRWTDAIVQGALSVGTVNSDDRIQLTKSYPAIREELDDEERNVRRLAGASRRSAHIDSSAASGAAGPITGFVLRSSAVSGWPGLHVRAFDVDPEEGDEALFSEDDPRRIRILRLERLAPAVLLCLFDGVPKVVHIEEPRQGIQFGFDFEETGLQRGATLTPRDVETFESLDGTVIDVPFRVGTSGVVDIRRLAEDLAEVTNTDTVGDPGPNIEGMDSAEYAQQLIRFPWRQVFGDVDNDRITAVFKPTVGFAQQATGFAEFDFETVQIADVHGVIRDGGT